MRTLPFKRIVFTLFACAVGLAGCAGGGGGGGGGADAGVRRSSSRVTAEELASVYELDLYGAIQRLRPAWLRPGTRGALPQLIVNGTPQSAGIESLRSYRATDAQEMELMSASDATTRYGTGYTAGAILVTTARR